MLPLATATIADIARRPLLLVLSALMLLGGQLALRAGLTPLPGALLARLLHRTPLPASVAVGAALGLLVCALLAVAAPLVFGVARRSRPAHDPRRGLAALPAAAGATSLGAATVFGLLLAATAAHAAAGDLGSVSRALSAALVLVPTALALLLVLASTLLALAWLAAGERAGSSLTDGLRALGAALVVSARDPWRLVRAFAALWLVLLPLQLAALATLPCWFIDLPAALPLHAIHALAVAGCLVGFTSGLRRALGAP